MSVTIGNKIMRFATEGFRVQRHNSDGTIASPQRFVGFANTADLSKVLTDDGAYLTIKIGTTPHITRIVDFTSAVDLSRVTVAEAVTSLNNANFPGIIFSADEITGRLKGSVSAGTLAETIQIVSPLAAALDFGQGIKHKGNGLEWLSYFNNETISIGLPKSVKDREEIDIESAKGIVTRMIIGAKILGKNPVITLKEKDYFLLELIQGGTLDRENGTYNPPLSGESYSPSFCVEIFSPTYSKDSNTLGDYTGFERLFMRSVTGFEGDIPIEAKGWAQYAFNCTATGYTDEYGKNFPAWEEQPLTAEQFDALRVRELGNLSENLSAAESR